VGKSDNEWGRVEFTTEARRTRSGRIGKSRGRGRGRGEDCRESANQTATELAWTRMLEFLNVETE
jgi:hypothetical protein